MALACKSTVSGLRAAAPQKVAVARVSRKSLVCRADGGFIGSSTNLIMVASTGLSLAAGRFGLAPTVKNGTNAGLKLSERSSSAGLLSGDPAGFTVVDVLALGALGHAIGVGIVLGLKGTGAL